MSVGIEKVSMTPSEVMTGNQFIISVKVQVSTYERLKAFTFAELRKFTHRNLKNDVLR